MPYLTLAQAALERWRAAQLVMDDAPPGSPAWSDASIEAELAKAAYQQAFDEAIAAHARVPLPFAEASQSDEPKTDMGAVGVDGEVYGG